jgi:pimeloyl-ACP methyl ester carboxylesterase
MTRLLRYRHDGLTFDVTDKGPLDGDPVVLLHGFPQRSSCWRLVTPLLNDHGLRTYAPDQRGYSRGARPEGRPAYRMNELAGDLTALVEAIGRPVHLVGHDWGAAVSWAVAGQRPDLVRSLTAVSVPHPTAFARSVVSSPQGLRSWYIAAFQVPFLPEQLGRRTSRFEKSLRGMGMREEEIARFRTEIVEDGALRGGLMWYRALPLFDRSALAGTVRVPTTFVWSDGDPSIDRAGGRHTPDFVEAPYRYVELGGVSHWIPEHAPDALAEAVLERVDSAS